MGWGFSVSDSAAAWRARGYRVEIVDHAEMAS